MQALLLLIGFGGGALVCWLILNKRNYRNLARIEKSQQATSHLASELGVKNSEVRQKIQEENQLNFQISELESRLQVVNQEQYLLKTKGS